MKTYPNNIGKTANPPSHQTGRRTIDATKPPTTRHVKGTTRNICALTAQTMASLFSLVCKSPMSRSQSNCQPKELRTGLRITPATTATKFRNTRGVLKTYASSPTMYCTQPSGIRTVYGVLYLASPGKSIELHFIDPIGVRPSILIARTDAQQGDSTKVLLVGTKTFASNQLLTPNASWRAIRAVLIFADDHRPRVIHTSLTARATVMV